MKILTYLSNVALLYSAVSEACPFFRSANATNLRRPEVKGSLNIERMDEIRRAYGNSVNDSKKASETVKVAEKYDGLYDESVRISRRVTSKEEKVRRIGTITATVYGALTGATLGGVVGFFAGVGVPASALGGAMLGGVTGSAVGYTTPIPTLVSEIIPSEQPTSIPTLFPTAEPTAASTVHNTTHPSTAPTCLPSLNPTAAPSVQSIASPTENPTFSPTRRPSVLPTLHPPIPPVTAPSMTPSFHPTHQSTVYPTTIPTSFPTSYPSFLPSCCPSVVPSGATSLFPTTVPAVDPTVYPTVAPTTTSTLLVTLFPTVFPSEVPTVHPTVDPSSLPTGFPSSHPSEVPTMSPTICPSSECPTSSPTEYSYGYAPSSDPTTAPSLFPAAQPTSNPTVAPSSVQPTRIPTESPTSVPSAYPTIYPTSSPSVYPSVFPSHMPTYFATFPTETPSELPTGASSELTTAITSVYPSAVPSVFPTVNPTVNPSAMPSALPSVNPTVDPTVIPTVSPSAVPSAVPSAFPTVNPTVNPSAMPSALPSVNPTVDPTVKPTVSPSAVPSAVPSVFLTVPPSTVNPTLDPSAASSTLPSRLPTQNPSVIPTALPSVSPSIAPSVAPSVPPTAVPSTTPSLAPSVASTTTSTRTPTSAQSSVPRLNACAKTNFHAITPNRSTICSAFYDIRYQFVVPSDELQRSNLFGQAVRLVFQDAGEVDIRNSVDLLGPDGCLAHNGDSAGLTEATSLVNTVMEPIWQSVCDRISRADFWVLFGKLVVEAAAPALTQPLVYQYGRVDNLNCEGGGGRLPSAQGGLEEFNRVFVNQMGLTMREAVALMGAHSLGHTHIANSGYGFVNPSQSPTRLNAWDLTPAVLDNGYYIDLVRNTWAEDLTADGTKTQWRQGTEPLINLNADLALRYSLSTELPVSVSGQSAQTCGPSAVNGAFGCVNPTSQTVPTTAQQVLQYSNNNPQFLADFAAAFVKMSAVGYGGVMSAVDGATTSGKLGTLTTIDLTTCPYQPPGNPSVRPTARPTTSPPTTKPTSAAPTARPTIPGQLRANLCAKTNFEAAPSSKEGICSAHKDILSQFPVPADELGRSNLYGQAVRLAFHDAGEVDIQTTVDLLGADGCMAHNGDSAGLTEVTSLVNTVMEPIWQSVCDRISRADFWVLFGKLVVERAASIPVTVPFQYGRVDNVECEGGAGRLPGGHGDLNEMQRVFVDQMGLTMDEAVTLLGAHSLGHTHIANSGYGFVDPSQSATRLNAWDLTPAILDNGYYNDLVRNTWQESLTSSGASTQWRQGTDPLIMLSTEMALRYPVSVEMPVTGEPAQVCGPTRANGSSGCVNPLSTTVPSTAQLCQRYAGNNGLFLSAFVQAFAKMSAVGYGSVVSTVDGATTTGKLGTLTTVDLTTCPP